MPELTCQDLAYTAVLAQQPPGHAESFPAKRSRKLEAKELTKSLRTSNGHLIHLLTSLGGSPW